MKRLNVYMTEQCVEMARLMVQILPLHISMAKYVTLCYKTSSVDFKIAGQYLGETYLRDNHNPFEIYVLLPHKYRQFIDVHLRKTFILIDNFESCSVSSYIDDEEDYSNVL